MCGRYTLHHEPEEVEERFDVEPDQKPLAPRYNIAPSQIIPVIRHAGSKEMVGCKWGLIHFWVKYAYSQAGALKNAGTDLTAGDPASNIASGLLYRDFGAVKQMGYGNGQQLQAGYSHHRQSVRKLKFPSASATIRLHLCRRRRIRSNASSFAEQIG